MRVSIFGTGYVGLVTGACLAEVGNHVVCMDIDADKVARLEQGEIPIYEPGLEALVKRNHAAGRLAFTTDADAATRHGEVVFIARVVLLVEEVFVTMFSRPLVTEASV